MDPLECTDTGLRYQPVLDLARGEVVALEARPRRDAAEVPLGAVLDEACRTAATWERKGLAVGVAVNASAAEVVLPGCADRVRDCLESSGLPAGRLTVEVSEHGLAAEPSAAAALRDLADLGVLVALDDFGTGQTSLAHLRRYPVHELKIDSSMVAGVCTSADDRAVVSSIVGLGRALGVPCVAQGVDAAGQVGQLLELACERVQGGLFSPPVRALQVPAAIDAAEAWTTRRPPQRTPTEPGVPVPDDVLRLMQQMFDAGASFPTITAALNQSGSRHPRGQQWHPTSVARVLAGPPRSRAVSA